MHIQQRYPFIFRLPSCEGDDGQYDIFAIAPQEMSREEARSLINKEIARANQEDAKNSESGDCGCDDGRGVEESIKKSLKDQGFLFFDIVETNYWDE